MEEPTNEFTPRIEVQRINEAYNRLQEVISKRLIGQNKLVELLFTAILSDGHVLIEGVPGVAKTYTAKLFAKLLDVGFSRIQFTPDLMPSDVTGTNVFNPKVTEFEFKQGPIFSNVVLIDEINRAPAKTQAALLECMEERQISSDGITHEMAEPFIVLATQNPVEHEGTYKLPEAQLDRFLFKLEINYPEFSDEVKLLEEVSADRINNDFSKIQPALISKDLQEYKALVNKVVIDVKLLEYIARLVHDTRENPDLFLGASPRASIGILNSSKALAAIRGRDFVTPDDIREVTVPVLNHRVVLSPEREMEGIKSMQTIEEIIEQIEVPR